MCDPIVNTYPYTIQVTNSIKVRGNFFLVEQRCRLARINYLDKPVAERTSHSYNPSLLILCYYNITLILGCVLQPMQMPRPLAKSVQHQGNNRTVSMTDLAPKFNTSPSCLRRRALPICLGTTHEPSRNGSYPHQERGPSGRWVLKASGIECDIWHLGRSRRR